MRIACRVLGAGASVAVVAQMITSTPVFAQSNQELMRIIEKQQQQIDQQGQIIENLQDEVMNLKQGQQQTQQQVQDTAERLGDKVVRSGKKNVALEISGQVNRMVNVAADGRNKDVFHVDNDNSSTRVRFVGKTQVDEKTTLGATVEVQFESNSSAAVSQDDERGVGPNNFTERKLEVTAQHDDYGKISVGQGSTASDGTAEVDLSKTTVINNSAVHNQAGGLQFRDSDTGMLTGVTIGDVFSNFDGLSRDDRVRIDSPKIMGFQLSGSTIAADRYDVAGRWSGKIGPVKAAAAVAHAHEARQESQDRSRLSGSASVLHEPTGLNLTVAAGKQDRNAAGRENPMFYYVKGGWITEFFGAGPTAFSVDHAKADAVAQNGDKFISVGAFVVQHLDDHGTELYAGVRQHKLKREGEDFDDIVVGSAGARVKF